MNNQLDSLVISSAYKIFKKSPIVTAYRNKCRHWIYRLIN